jgi:beta-phosphoglucomutase-like phosphatase (HAD superfamily)
LLCLNPRDCVVVEDAFSGVEAAHRAGMTAFAIPTTYARSELSHADVLLERLDQLQAASIHAAGETRILLRW